MTDDVQRGEVHVQDTKAAEDTRGTLAVWKGLTALENGGGRHFAVGDDSSEVAALERGLEAGTLGVLALPGLVRPPRGRPYFPFERADGLDPKDEADLTILDEAAYAFASIWVGEPATRAVIRRRARAAVLSAPAIAVNFLVDELQIARFAWYLAGVTGRTDDIVVWFFPTLQQDAIMRRIDVLRRYFRRTAELIAGQGMPIQPGWPGDLAVVAEMLFLDAIPGVEIPWNVQKRELAEFFSVAGIVASLPDLNGQFVRARAPFEVEEAVMQLRKRALARQLGGPVTERVFNGGRGLPRSEEDLEEIAKHVEVMRRTEREMPGFSIGELLAEPTGPERKCYARHHQDVFGYRLGALRSRPQLYRDAKQAGRPGRSRRSGT